MRKVGVCLLGTILCMVCAPGLLVADDLVLSHWLTAPLSQVDLDDHWILASLGDRLMKVPVDDPDSKEEIQLESPIADLILKDGIAFVLTEDQELKAIDPDAPLEEDVLGSLLLQYPFTAMAFDEEQERIYLAGSGHLGVVDVSDPENPRSLARFELSHSAKGIDVDGGRVFLSSSYDFDILQITDELQMVEIGTWQGHIADLKARGESVFICASDRKLGVISIADPATPELIAEIRGNGYSVSLDLVGDFALVAGGSSDQCDTIDISEPGNPVLLGEIFWYGVVNEVAAQGERCAVAVENSLSYLDIGFPPRPYPLWSIAFSKRIRFITAEGQRLYAVTDRGVQVFEFSLPNQLVEGPILEFEHPISSINVSEGLLLVHPTFRREFYPVDFSDLEHPVEYPAWIHWGSYNDIEFNNGIVYLAVGSDGIELFDFSDPSAPVLSSSIILSESAAALTIEGNLAVVLGEEPELMLSFLDISNPRSPILMGEFSVDGLYSGPISGGGLIFFSDNDSFHVLEPGDGSNARILASVEIGEKIRTLTWVRGQLWCRLWSGTVEIFDLSDPSRPRLVRTFDGIRLSSSLAVGRDFVAGWSSDGVWIFDDGPFVLDPRLAGGRVSP